MGTDDGRRMILCGMERVPWVCGCIGMGQVPLTHCTILNSKTCPSLISIHRYTCQDGVDTTTRDRDS
jgi:hypothetical protein